MGMSSAEKTRRYRDAKRARGECWGCREQALPGLRSCAKHRTRDADGLPVCNPRAKERVMVQLTVSIEQLSPIERAAWEHKLAGRTAKQAAAIMGCHYRAVEQAWLQARRRQEPSRLGELDAKFDAMAKAGRCHCGLILPCYHEDRNEAAQRRQYVGIGWSL
jgi:hypothetical protein